MESSIKTRRKVSANEEPRTPIVFQGTKHKESPMSTSISQDEGRECRSKKKTKTENLEDNRPAIIFKIQRKENSNHVTLQQRVKTELPEVNLTSSPTTRSPTQENGQGIPSSPLESGGDLLSALSGPPGEPELTGFAPEMLQGYKSAIFTVKKTLISFLTGSNPTDVACMINQANDAFLCLKGLHADYQSFYTSVRSYIGKCAELCKVEKELNENMQAVKVVSRHEKLVCQLDEAARAVTEIEADLQKAKKYMAPLEARVQDTKDLLEKLELELAERQTEIQNLEADRLRQLDAKDAASTKLQDVVLQAEEARGTLRYILGRREAARVAMEASRAQLAFI